MTEHTQSTDRTPSTNQEQVDAFFKGTLTYWKDIYFSEDAQPLMYRQRLDATIEWIEALKPGREFRVLDVGCGAGILPLSLARRGVRAHGIDPVPEMVHLAQQIAAEWSVGERVSFDVGNIYAINAPDNSYDVVVALGVFIYLDRPIEALREMMRVAKPGGHIIVSTENPYAFMWWFDPISNPVLQVIWKPIVAWLRKHDVSIPNPFPSRMNDSGAVWLPAQLGNPRLTDKQIATAGLRKLNGKTMSFYPIKCLQHDLLPKSIGIWLGQHLDHLARQGVPVIRSSGEIYLVMAEKDGVRADSPTPRG